jgi:hypothetical protein
MMNVYSDVQQKPILLTKANGYVYHAQIIAYIVQIILHA